MHPRQIYFRLFSTQNLDACLTPRALSIYRLNLSKTRKRECARSARSRKRGGFERDRIYTHLGRAEEAIGDGFPRARARRHFPRVAALLSTRGLKSPDPGAPRSPQTPWCLSRRAFPPPSLPPSLPVHPVWRSTHTRVVADHNTLCLPKAVSGRLVLARVKLLENQLLLRYCL